jgi:HK97 family phage portal protein
MSKKRKRQIRASNDATIRDLIRVLNSDEYDKIHVMGYTSLDQNPEVLTACRKIADMISTMTVHLMSNTDNGDVRIINELSRKLDIQPNDYMTRKTFMDIVVMNMLLYGKGNSVVRVHTQKGLIGDLEPISPYRVGFQTDRYKYKIMIDGVPNDPNDNLLHFVLNPDPVYPWWGRGLTTCMRDVANNIKQARATEKSFMESKWKPSVIVKVDALTDEFSGPAGRK